MLWSLQTYKGEVFLFSGTA